MEIRPTIAQGWSRGNRSGLESRKSRSRGAGVRAGARFYGGLELDGSFGEGVSACARDVCACVRVGCFDCRPVLLGRPSSTN